MKVTALQGDTLDQLCHRHYGKTKGVTEAVLSDTQPAQEMVQLWS